MKKLLLMAGVLLCMLLTACNGATQGQTSGEEDSKEVTGVSEAVLYDDQGLKLILKASLDVDNDYNCYVLQAFNHNDQSRSIDVDNWIINDTIVLSEPNYLYPDAESETSQFVKEMTSAVLMEEIDAIESIKCHIVINDENYEQIDEKEVVLELKEPLVAGVVYDAFMDARAGEQVLVEDENVKVTLKGWGKDPGSGYVRGVLHFENKSDIEIPVKVTGISVNGIYLEVSDRVNFLEPSESCYGVCSVLDSEIEDEGIKSITSLELLVMTAEEQNTGSVSYSGGEWYPIVLEEQGDADVAFETGEFLDGTDEVEISYIQQEESVWSAGGGVYKWKLAIVNDSDENIEIAVTDVTLDGMSKEDWSEDDIDKSFYVSERKVGAHSHRYIYLNAGYGETISRPEISFKIQIRSMAGGAVIYSSEKQITIAPDKE